MHAQTPAWYGKLPAVGDFASRRWPEALIEPWDQWLAQGLDGLRRQDPEGWLAGYLDSPIWRFVLCPGVLGPAQDQVLAGVLMPSVDRVGRYFPLSIVSPLPRLPHTIDEAQALFAWLHAIDDLAADVLQEDWSIERMEQALARTPAPAWSDAGLADTGAWRALAQGPARLLPLTLPEPRQAMIVALVQGLLQWVDLTPSAQAPSWWWAEPQADPQQRQTWLGRGLPTGADFRTLLGAGLQADRSDRADPVDHTDPADPARRAAAPVPPDPTVA